MLAVVDVVAFVVVFVVFEAIILRGGVPRQSIHAYIYIYNIIYNIIWCEVV